MTESVTTTDRLVLTRGIIAMFGDHLSRDIEAESDAKAVLKALHTAMLTGRTGELATVAHEWLTRVGAQPAPEQEQP